MDARGVVTVDLPTRARDPRSLPMERLGAARITPDARVDRPLAGALICAAGLMGFALQDVIIKLIYVVRREARISRAHLDTSGVERVPGHQNRSRV